MQNTDCGIWTHLLICSDLFRFKLALQSEVHNPKSEIGYIPLCRGNSCRNVPHDLCAIIKEMVLLLLELGLLIFVPLRRPDLYGQ